MTEKSYNIKSFPTCSTQNPDELLPSKTKPGPLAIAFI